jgi:hypothetical protein
VSEFSFQKRDTKMHIKKIAIPLFFLSTSSIAAPFNSLDARAMAMGDTGVAAAKPGSASQFNPALLSNYSNDEDFSLILPNAGASAVADEDAMDAFTNIEDEEYLDNIEQAIDSFNNGSDTTGNAQIIADNALEFNTQLGNLSGQPINVDASALVSVAIPNKTIGIGVYANAFAVVEAAPIISECDQDLFATYAEVAQDIADGGTPGQTFSDCGYEVYDGAADFINPADPNDDDDSSDTYMTSNIDIAGVTIEEVGISFAHAFTIFGKDVSFGVTPKAMDITSYHVIASVQELDDDNYDLGDELEDSENTDSDVNIDLGIAANFFNNNLTVGLTIKNILEKSYETSSEREFDISPQARAGIAWDLPIGLTLASDIDLSKNKPYFSGEDTQYFGAGLEWDVFNSLRLRAGARTNLSNSDDTAFTAGLGFNIIAVHLDLAGQVSDNNAGLALQLGVEF